MKVVCSQSELNGALQLVSRAVATRPTHPVLANVLLTADAGSNRLSLTGFDLSLGIQTSLAASVETSGAITLPARLLGEIVSRLSSDSPVTLAVDESGEQVQLTSLSGSYQMRGMSADDYPDLPMVESGMTLKLQPERLVQALKAPCLPAVLMKRSNCSPAFISSSTSELWRRLPPMVTALPCSMLRMPCRMWP